MFESISIYITEECSLDDVRDRVELVTRERLKEATDDVYGRYYETQRNSEYFTTIETFTNDRLLDVNDIPLSRLPITVTFTPYSRRENDNCQEKCREIALQCANDIFNNLHCSCLVVEDMHKLVKKFKSAEDDWL